MPDEALASDLDGGPTGGPVTLLLPLVVGSFAAFVLLGISRRRFAAARSGASAGSGPEPGEESPPDPFVPRWLRPSVAAARVGIGPTTVIEPEAPALAEPGRPRRVFTGGIDRGVERVVVRYDRVPLLDVPDDALGRTKADLDADDEVEVIERDGIWAQVRTPTGAVGWVPTMTIAQRAGREHRRRLSHSDYFGCAWAGTGGRRAPTRSAHRGDRRPAPRTPATREWR